jgi:hypothetical protein
MIDYLKMVYIIEYMEMKNKEDMKVCADCRKPIAFHDDEAKKCLKEVSIMVDHS